MGHSNSAPLPALSPRSLALFSVQCNGQGEDKILSRNVTLLPPFLIPTGVSDLPFLSDLACTSPDRRLQEARASQVVNQLSNSNRSRVDEGWFDRLRRVRVQGACCKTVSS